MAGGQNAVAANGTGAGAFSKPCDPLVQLPLRHRARLYPIASKKNSTRGGQKMIIVRTETEKIFSAGDAQDCAALRAASRVTSFSNVAAATTRRILALISSAHCPLRSGTLLSSHFISFREGGAYASAQDVLCVFVSLGAGRFGVHAAEG
jgi:hypothetical protein